MHAGMRVHRRAHRRDTRVPASLRLAGCILQPRRSLNCIQRAPPCQQPCRQSAALQAKVPFIFFLLSSDVFHSGLISSNPGCGRDRAAGGGGSREKKSEVGGGAKMNLLTLFTLASCTHTVQLRELTPAVRLDMLPVIVCKCIPAP